MVVGCPCLTQAARFVDPHSESKGIPVSAGGPFGYGWRVTADDKLVPYGVLADVPQDPHQPHFLSDPQSSGFSPN